MPRRTLVLLALTAALLGGCTRVAPPVATPKAVTREQAMQLIQPMPRDKRASAMPEGLPFEVAVPDGTVTRAVADNRPGGDGLWLYDLESTATPEVMDQWYQGQYAIREWRLTSTQREGSVTQAVIVDYFRKGSGAETMLRIRRTAKGCAVEASVGLGVPLDRSL